MTPITVRYAETDDDVILIHRFLCIIAGPGLPGPIDPKKSIEEIWRVVDPDPEHTRPPSDYGFALMAFQGDELVGTIGLVRADYWWGNVWFFANRWFYVLPGAPAWKPLLKEAKTIAVAAELELHIITEGRGKLLILNRSRLRHGIRPEQTNRVIH